MDTDRFFVLRASVAQERSQWLQLWEDWDDAEVFAHPAYVQLFATDNAEALCGVFEVAGRPTILIPSIIRRIDGAESLRDLVSPYGYGGSYRLRDDVSPGEVERFWKHYTEWAVDHSVVSEFYRFHLFEDEITSFPGDVLHRANNVVRDLDLPEEQLRMDFEHKVRKNVNRARKLGATVSIHQDASHHEDFLRICESTMDRRNAAKDYYFSRSFFGTINEQLPGSYAYAHAWMEGRIVSTELVLISGRRAYSFLGGTDHEAFAARPNDLLKYEVMQWGRERGLKSFVLGGGATAGDGIERYKAAFAPRGVRPFSTGQRVLRRDDYLRLTAQREREIGIDSQSGYFPAYRAPAAPPLAEVSP